MLPICSFPAKRWLRLSLVLAVAFVFAVSCATQPIPSGYDPPGFLMGAGHGFTMVFSLVGSFFQDVRIYAFPNSGVWYDVGYVIGAALFLGGSGAAA